MGSKLGIDNVMPARIHKLLADNGYGSRREIESWIRAGRIRVNGSPAKLGQQIDGKDRISLDQKSLRVDSGRTRKNRILAFYKPAGVICTSRDPEGRKTVFEYLPDLKKQRWVSVGRLDINTSGLILFVNNGDWAHRLMHPANIIEREYAVRILGKVEKVNLRNLRTGVMLNNRLAQFTDIVATAGKGVNQWFHVVLMEGRNRQVRKMWESQGFQVSRLIRVRYGSYILPKAKKPGEVWPLTNTEAGRLMALADKTG